MNEEEMQEKIDNAPKKHRRKNYTVNITDKRGNRIATRYVTATSKRRAALTGAKVNKYIFGDRRTFGAEAEADEPVKWR